MDLGGVYQVLFSAWGSVARRLPAGVAPPPLQLFFEISDRCNQRCGFCFYRGDIDAGRGGEMLTRGEVERCVAAAPSARLAAFAGAEPFCRPDFHDILESVSRRRITSVETNATMITGDLPRRLVRMSFSPARMTGLASVDVSIHGDARTHDRITGVQGSHARTIRAIRGIADARAAAGRRFPLIHVKAVVCAGNAGRLADIHRLAAEIRADAFILKLRDQYLTSFHVRRGSPIVGRTDAGGAFPVGALRADLKTIRGRTKGPPLMTIPLGLDERTVIAHCAGDGSLDGWTCTSPWTRVSVMPYGDIFLCKAFGSGSVRREGVMKAWNGEPARAFRRRIAADTLPDECAGCCFLTRKETYFGGS